MLPAPLPSELLDTITDYFDTPTLRAARLVNKTWSSYATKHLFNTVVMTPTPEGIARWRNIMRSKQLRQIPRRAIINSAPVPDFDVRTHGGRSHERAVMWEWYQQSAKGPSDNFTPAEKKEWKNHIHFHNSFEDLVTLPDLKEVELRFTSHCGRAFYQPYWEHESVRYREDLLHRLFKALKQRQLNQCFQPIRTLSIQNLQNIPTQLTKTQDFKDVLHDVDNLDLFVTEKDDDRRTFMHELRANWLQPLQARLKSLSLSSLNCWGSLPGHFDGKGLLFPRLEHLWLQEFCFGHDDAIDWITNQRHLKSLQLVCCRIVSHIRLAKDNSQEWNPPTHDWIKLPHGAYGYCIDGYCNDGDCNDGDVYLYRGTWANIFDKIRQRLPLLRSFGNHYDDEQDVWTSTEAGSTPIVSLSGDRYTAFGTFSSQHPWFSTRADGKIGFGIKVEAHITGNPARYVRHSTWINPAKNTADEDGPALVRLATEIGRRGGTCRFDPCVEDDEVDEDDESDEDYESDESDDPEFEAFSW